MSRTTARDAAVRMTYAWQMGGEIRIQDDFFREENFDSIDQEFIDQLLGGVKAHVEEIDASIGENSQDWRIERIARVDLAVLRIAGYELLFPELLQTPPKVAINEAVEIAKKYGDEDSGKYVNGVLGGMLRSLSSVAE